jgi:hypothetical protein
MLDYELFLSFACCKDLTDFYLFSSPPPLATEKILDIDDDSEEEFNIDEKTGELHQYNGIKKIPNMGIDGIFKTPIGIRYKIFFIRNTYSTIHIQYIQPDGKYASPGEAIKLPNGEVYKGKNNDILCQKEVPETIDLLSENEVMEPGMFFSVEDLNFDFGYKYET